MSHTCSCYPTIIPISQQHKSYILKNIPKKFHIVSCSVLEGEAVALCEALQALQLRGISHVMIESDSKNLVDALHHLRGGNSEFSSLVSYINTLLLSSPNFSVKFIKRRANMVAHTLARAAIS
jgi:ribonuclease HI